MNLTDPIFTDEAKARAHFEATRWPDGAYCPFCGQTETVKKLGGASMGPGWYHCSDCRRKFTALVGTVLERSHIPLTKWLMAMHLMCSSKKGISAHQLHRSLGVSYKSAWFMAMRIREAMRETQPDKQAARFVLSKNRHRPGARLLTARGSKNPQRRTRDTKLVRSPAKP